MSEEEEPRGVFEATCPEEVAVVLRTVCTLVDALPIEVLRSAVEKLDRSESVGPILYPSLWTDGRRFKNLRAWKNVFDGVLKLKNALDEAKSSGEKVS